MAEREKSLVYNMDVKAIFALVLVGLGVLLDIVGLAIPYWRYLSGDTGTFKYGLWSFCLSYPGFSECVSFTSDLGLSA